MPDDSLAADPVALSLNYDDYFLLLGQRDQVNKEFDALGSIVMTANMNVEVLMQNLLEKKKRSIARIDASQVGQLYLASMLEEAPTYEIEAIVKRITTGSRVKTLREETNVVLTHYSHNVNTITLPENARKMLCWKIVETLKQKLKTKTILGLEMKGLDDSDIFVCEVILEELVWLQNRIKAE